MYRRNNEGDGGDTIKFKCKFCKIIFTIETFDELEEFRAIPVTKKSQCFITRKGVPHNLKPHFGSN